MRVMVFVKATQDSEAARMPTTEELAAMGAYNEALAAAGVMKDGDGLHPSSAGKRIHFAKGGPTVQDGPFGTLGELVSGYWIWEVADMDAAVDWARKAPFPPGQQLELRRFYEAEDFGEAFTPELREREEALRQQTQG